MLMLRKLREALLSTPYAKPYKDDYVWVRCPVCGDSDHRIDKPHCTIWLRPDAPVVFHCWVKECKGIVDHKFLKDLGINDANLYSELGQHNKATAKRTNGSVKFVSYKDYTEIKVPKIREENPFVRMKLEYMRNRMGIPYTCSSLEYLRVITSLRDFLIINNLQPTGNWNINKLDKYYIGFLSSDKSLITFRDITDTQTLKYIKYKVFDVISDGEAFYSIPMPVDPLEENLELNICEGTFDLHGVFFHVKKANLKNNLYVAVCGSGYPRVLKYFLRKGFLMNLTVNIFSDLDKDPNWYKRILEGFDFWFNDINVYYNSVKGEKDFGVRKEQIKIRKAVFRSGKYF